MATEKGIQVAADKVDDVLTYALFPQVGLKFLANRNNPDAFEPVPGSEPEPVAAAPAPPVGGPEAYTVSVNGKAYNVTVSAGGEVQSVAPTVAAAPTTAPAPAAAPAAPSGGEPLPAPLSGTIFKVQVTEGQSVSSGDVVMVMEAMKMETDVRATRDGVVASITVKEGDAVQVGDVLLMLS